MQQLITGTTDPWETQATLLSAHRMARDGMISARRKRAAEDEKDKDDTQCTIGGAPPRLCK